MADPSTNSATQEQAEKDRRANTKANLTPEQVQAIADRVYAMLLRDLQQEHERYRILARNSGTFKRG